MPRRSVVFMLPAMLAVAFVGARHSSSAEKSQSSDVRNHFLGTWKLVSAEDTMKDGSTRPYPDTGPHGLGYLMYTPDGHMCANLMNPDRPKWDVPPTAAQKVAAIEGMAAYCGTFKIDEINHVMLHYPEVAWMPNYVGTEQRRPYKFEGNHLSFSGPGQSDEPDVAQWTITWEKVK